MTQTELLVLNFEAIRSKSIRLWKGLPESHYHWKPDESAMTAIQMIRHVLEADYGWNIIINQGDMTNYRTPWENRPCISVHDELEFAAPYREKFLESVGRFSAADLSETKIIHPGNGEKKTLGKYLLRIGYHEAVHAGQFLSYLRAMEIDRPGIWD
ncbi:DinB family protein [Maribacter polysaccharolyticus]|uniref:DinB family protein n=1 Tax=Maribacter polysaccharolyticus TaxID=3020831 RepID=UPI00237F9986|nr:DinB family protein [Maribacter polysaccharolyticus]MDE3743286.1 DinB family protein [Maribacter polysaccharolyticus]